MPPGWGGNSEVRMRVLVIFGCGLWVVGCRLSVVCCLLLVVGCRLSVVGCRLSVVCCLLSVVGCWLLVVGCWFSVFGYELSVDWCFFTTETQRARSVSSFLCVLSAFVVYESSAPIIAPFLNFFVANFHEITTCKITNGNKNIEISIPKANIFLFFL